MKSPDEEPLVFGLTPDPEHMRLIDKELIQAIEGYETACANFNTDVMDTGLLRARTELRLVHVLYNWHEVTVVYKGKGYSVQKGPSPKLVRTHIRNLEG